MIWNYFMWKMLITAQRSNEVNEKRYLDTYGKHFEQVLDENKCSTWTVVIMTDFYTLSTWFQLIFGRTHEKKISYTAV